jgi:hypothetical protein
VVLGCALLVACGQPPLAAAPIIPASPPAPAPTTPPLPTALPPAEAAAVEQAAAETPSPAVTPTAGAATLATQTAVAQEVAGARQTAAAAQQTAAAGQQGPLQTVVANQTVGAQQLAVVQQTAAAVQQTAAAAQLSLAVLQTAVANLTAAQQTAVATKEALPPTRVATPQPTVPTTLYAWYFKRPSEAPQLCGPGQGNPCLDSASNQGTQYISGHVIDQHRAPVPGIIVQARNGQNVLFNSTDANGFYSILLYTNCPKGPLSWDVYIVDGSLSLSSYVKTITYTDCAQAGEFHVDFVEVAHS